MTSLHLYAVPSIRIIPAIVTGAPVQCLGTSSYKLSAFDHMLTIIIRKINVCTKQLHLSPSPSYIVTVAVQILPSEEVEHEPKQNL